VGRTKAIGAIVILRARRCRQKGETDPFPRQWLEDQQETDYGQPHGCGRVLISPEEEMALRCWIRLVKINNLNSIYSEKLLTSRSMGGDNNSL
jgi:hypothetical protein